MFRPDIAPRMKEANDFAAMRVNAGNVWTLEAVAMDASQGEVINIGGSAMLASDDVIDLEGRRVKPCWQLAILTLRSCSLPNLAYEIFVQVSDYCARLCSARRPLDCITAIRFPTWM